MQEIISEDIQKFGLIPELIGRLPVFAALEPLTVLMIWCESSRTKECFSEAISDSSFL